MRLSGAMLLVLISATGIAQSLPDLRFGGHTLGETAETFFATATMMDSRKMTEDYCKALLADAKTAEKAKSFENSLENQTVTVLNKKDFIVFDAEGCEKIEAALRGDNTSVSAGFASELGKGDALFASGRLVAFNLVSDKPYLEAVADMEHRFGFPGQKYIVARPGWPNLEELRWETGDVLGSVFKEQFSDTVTVLIGYLRPPYESYLRGTPASAPESKPCEAASKSAPPKQVSQGVIAGLAFHKIPPVYPASAKQNHIQGRVVLDAVIDQCGQIAELRPISGPVELFQATVSAVKQWQYRPYVVSGVPMAVETQITVNFQLSPKQ